MSQGSRKDLLERVHGNSGYRRGCRCDTCREGHREAARAAAKRIVRTVDRRAGREVSPPWNSVPTARIWPLIEQWIRKHDGQSRYSRPGEGGLAQLARRLDCDAKAIAVIRDREWITFRKADRILVAMDRLDYWHTELHDIYSLERDAERAA